jgi:hypothetical protein
MKFYIRRTSQPAIIMDMEDCKEPPCDGCTDSGSIHEDNNSNEYRWTIEIDTLEQLIALQKKVEWELIIKEDTIEIYDNLRE